MLQKLHTIEWGLDDPRGTGPGAITTSHEAAAPLLMCYLHITYSYEKQAHTLVAVRYTFMNLICGSGRK